ncbi:MAG: hypothetical protein HKO63_09920, partial [Acidimicrobiia bacterium]|nr:hypothetical protein [Acidimicrobiia bacterium]
SEDGVTWDRIPPDVSGLDGPGGYMIHDLTRGGPGYIAVGAALEEGQTAAAVWVSPDGISWNRVDSPSFVDEAMFAVSAADSGIVAVWQSAWYSPDGVEWQRVETPAGFGAWDVAHADWGYVAVGERGGPLVQDEFGGWVKSQRPYAWTSQDGMSWESIDLHPTEEWIGAEVYSVMARGNEVVVAGSLAQRFGSYFDAPPAFWTTSDGSQWSEHPLDSLPVPGMTKPEAFIEGLAETESGMVAVGFWVHSPKAPGDEGWGRAAVWATSDEGSTWKEVSAGDTFGEASGMWDVVVLDGVVFAVGDHAGGAAVWIGEWSD